MRHHHGVSQSPYSCSSSAGMYSSSFTACYPARQSPCVGIIIQRRSSSLSKLLLKHRHILPTDVFPLEELSTPPWLLQHLENSRIIPGTFKKGNTHTVVLCQCLMAVIKGIRGCRAHVPTGGSTSASSSMVLLVFPAQGMIYSYKLIHRTSLTAEEVVPIHKEI